MNRAHKLREIRLDRGISHAGLAERVKVSRAYVSMLESGTKSGSDAIWTRLEWALDAEGEFASPTTPEASPDTLTSLAQRLAVLRRREDESSAVAVMAEASTIATVAADHVRQVPYELHREYAIFASEASQYLGWLNIVTRRSYDAELDRALSLAVEIGDSNRVAHALSFRGYAALREGRPKIAVDLTKAALRDTTVSPHFRAYDMIQLAASLTNDGERRRSAVALRMAERAVDRLTGPPPPSGYWYVPDFFEWQLKLVAERQKALRH